MARGSAREVSQGKVAVTFGWDLLDKINEMAQRDEISFAEAVRRICAKHFEATQ